MANKLQIQKGQIFGKWTIVEETENRILPSKQKMRQFICICECNNQSIVSLPNLQSGKSKSCGCLQKEIAKNLAIKKFTKHNNYKNKLYQTWSDMKQRCLNKNNKHYKDYGGRGIKVCNRWLNSFENFLQDMGQKPNGYSLDRINNNGNYEPSNCRWGTPIQQIHNRRITKKKEVTLELRMQEQ